MRSTRAILVPERRRRERLTFLVVDDHPEVLELVRLILRGSGHDCLIARSARDARDLIEREAPDIMLLDVTMPEVDGPTFLRQLRSEGVEVPRVAFLSALPTAELKRLSDEFGVPAIEKPFTGSSLREAIERLFGVRVQRS